MIPLIQAAIAALLLQAPPPETVFLTCSIDRETFSERMEPLGVVRQERTFRLSASSFQEWSAEEKRFGINMCTVYSCEANADKTEGKVGSASVVYTIGVDRKTGRGYWSSVGASGNAQTKGDCRIASDPSAARPRS